MEKSGYEYDNKYDWVELLNKKLEEVAGAFPTIYKDSDLLS